MEGFWATHYNLAEVGRKLGFTRQNASQRVKKGYIPCEMGERGERGVLMVWVDERVGLSAPQESTENQPES